MPTWHENNRYMAHLHVICLCQLLHLPLVEAHQRAGGEQHAAGRDWHRCRPMLAPMLLRLPLLITLLGLNFQGGIVLC